MVTGFSGHNKGKKKVKGGGYRYPEKKKVPPVRKFCIVCGKEINRKKTFVLDHTGCLYHDECFELQKPNY